MCEDPAFLFVLIPKCVGLFIGGGCMVNPIEFE